MGSLNPRSKIFIRQCCRSRVESPHILEWLASLKIGMHCAFSPLSMCLIFSKRWVISAPKELQSGMTNFLLKAARNRMARGQMNLVKVSPTKWHSLITVTVLSSLPAIMTADSWDFLNLASRQNRIPSSSSASIMLPIVMHPEAHKFPFHGSSDSKISRRVEELWSPAVFIRAWLLISWKLYKMLWGRLVVLGLHWRCYWSIGAIPIHDDIRHLCETWKHQKKLNRNTTDHNLFCQNMTWKAWLNGALAKRDCLELLLLVIFRTWVFMKIKWCSPQ